ncbi:hypothetical protein ABH944_004854 [Caballeronia udeis]|uniref:Secreted protein n=1 Tax=Caballeronia udeis TaxID=1232866 RepID=A0ABW8MRV9_9BURK
MRQTGRRRSWRSAHRRRMLRGLCHLCGALLRGPRFGLMQQRDQARKECTHHFRFPKTSRVASVSSLRRLKSPRTSPGLRPMRSLPTS